MGPRRRWPAEAYRPSPECAASVRPVQAAHPPPPGPRRATPESAVGPRRWQATAAIAQLTGPSAISRCDAGQVARRRRSGSNRGGSGRGRSARQPIVASLARWRTAGSKPPNACCAQRRRPAGHPCGMPGRPRLACQLASGTRPPVTPGSRVGLGQQRDRVAQRSWRTGRPACAGPGAATRRRGRGRRRRSLSTGSAGSGSDSSSSQRNRGAARASASIAGRRAAGDRLERRHARGRSRSRGGGKVSLARACSTARHGRRASAPRRSTARRPLRYSTTPASLQHSGLRTGRPTACGARRRHGDRPRSLSSRRRRRSALFRDSTSWKKSIVPQL